MLWWLLLGFLGCQSSSEDLLESGESLQSQPALTTLSRRPSLSGQVSPEVIRETLSQVGTLVREQGEEAPSPLVATFLMLKRLAGQNVPQQQLSQWIFQGGQYPPLLLEVIYLKLLQNRFTEVGYYLSRLKKLKKASQYKDAISHVENLLAWFRQDRTGALEGMKKQMSHLPARLMVAQTALQAGFWKEAADLFSGQKIASARFGEATARRLTGDFEGARKLFQELFEEYPEDKRVFWNYLLTLEQMLPERKEELLALEGKQSRLKGVFPKLDQKLSRSGAIFQKAKQQAAAPAPKEE